MRNVRNVVAVVLAAAALLGVGMFIGANMTRSREHAAPGNDIEITDTLPAPATTTE
jgi:hypothetical protein